MNSAAVSLSGGMFSPVLGGHLAVTAATRIADSTKITAPAGRPHRAVGGGFFAFCHCAE